MNVFPLIHVEMEAGDALFFHCNLLHGSDQNNSDLRRWVMISSYNQKRNNPLYKHHHSQYHPLEMVSNQAIIKCDPAARSTVEKWYMDPKTDVSARKD